MTTFPNTHSSKVAPGLALSVAAMIGSLAPAAVLLFLGQPAAAQTAPASRAAEVRIDVQNMTPEAAHQRIAVAASKLCNAVTVHSPLLPRAQQDCRHDTEARAMAQLADAPKLLASRD